MNISTLPDDPVFLKQILADQSSEIALLAEQVRLLKALRLRPPRAKSPIGTTNRRPARNGQTGSVALFQ